MRLLYSKKASIVAISLLSLAGAPLALAEGGNSASGEEHAIYPTDADHYRLYWGDDREALLEEITNWPTYYPSDLDGEGIVREMLAH